MTLSVTSERNTKDINAITFQERKKEIDSQKQAENEQRQREKKSPYTRWTQFNNQHTRELITLAMKYPKAHAILYFLVDNMDEYNAVMVSSQVIEEILGISRTTVYRNVKILEQQNFIAILKSATSNIYTINDDIYWRSWGNNHKYSKFPANIILSDSEQTIEYQNKIKALKTKTIEIKE